MQIVIDISDEDYKYFCNSSISYNLKALPKQNSKDIDGTLRILNLIDVIKNGTPLPKGHGRLIDENELLKMTKSYKSELGRLKADPFVKCGVETVESFIKEIPPIIEADKESDKDV